MEYGNYYTEETLRSLNAAYDTLFAEGTLSDK